MPNTSARPAGGHLAPASVHHLQLDELADGLIARLPGHRRQTETLARESGVSVVLMAMEAGDALDEHAAKGAVTIHLLRGHASLAAEGSDRELRPGDLVMLQPGVRHDILAVEQSVVLLTLTGGETA